MKKKGRKMIMKKIGENAKMIQNNNNKKKKEITSGLPQR
jgi:hypothetical protein